MKNVRDLLKLEFSKRVNDNPSYSVRAFARYLDIHPGTLSGYLNGNRSISLKTANHIFDKFNVSPLQRAEVLKKTKVHNEKASLKNAYVDRLMIEQQTFEAISQWYHYGILQLIRTEEYLENPDHSHPRWISKKLQVPINQVKLAIDRLLQLNLITLQENGFFKRTEEAISVKDKSVTTPALKNLQKDIRRRAISSIDDDPIEKRSMTSMTMAIDPDRMDEAKKLIEEFELKLSEFLETGTKKEVYQLSVSLFPIKGDLK